MYGSYLGTSIGYYSAGSVVPGWTGGPFGGIGPGITYGGSWYAHADFTDADPAYYPATADYASAQRIA